MVSEALPAPEGARGRPAATPEGRNNQLISLAVDLAERQLLAGTASSQVITHYLKESSLKTTLEIEKLRKETSLLAAREKDMASQQNQAALLEEALAAFKSYSGDDDGSQDVF